MDGSDLVIFPYKPAAFVQRFIVVLIKIEDGCYQFEHIHSGRLEHGRIQLGCIVCGFVFASSLVESTNRGILLTAVLLVVIYESVYVSPVV